MLYISAVTRGSTASQAGSAHARTESRRTVELGEDRRRVILCLAAVSAVVTVAVYVNGLHNPFVYDDRLTILDNRTIRDLLNVRAIVFGSVFRPLVNLSFAVDYAVWGLRPTGYHLTSLVIHVANVLLFFSAVRLLVRDRQASQPSVHAGRPDLIAFTASVAFGVHPVMTQAVGYVSGRPDVLCGFFFLLAVLAIRSWSLGGRRWWLAAGLAAWVCALLSKETAVMLPFVLLAYDRFLLAGRPGAAHNRLSRLHVPLFACLAGVAAARLGMLLWVETARPARFVWANVAVSFEVIRRYVQLVAVPGHQSIFHTARAVTRLLDAGTALNLGIIVAAVVAVVAIRRRASLVAFGTAWLLLLLVPAAVLLVFDVGEPLAEQRVYTASMGFFLAAGAAFGDVFARTSSRPLRATLAVAAACMVAALAFSTVTRNVVWADPVRLWEEAVLETPDIWVPYQGLGDALRDGGDCGAAVGMYREALRRGASGAQTQLSLGGCLLDLGQVEDADRAFMTALALQPRSYAAWFGRGLVAQIQGRQEAAREHYLRAIAENPGDTLARQRLAGLYETAFADPVAALRLCREVSSLAPGTAGIEACIRRNEAGSRQTTGSAPK
jgi:protein O-mannosyl-transferase